MNCGFDARRSAVGSPAPPKSARMPAASCSVPARSCVGMGSGGGRGATVRSTTVRLSGRGLRPSYVRVVLGARTAGEEDLPLLALRVFHPTLLAVGVTTGRRALLVHRATDALQTRIQVTELSAALSLNPEFLNPNPCVPLADCEVRPRIIEHPLRVVGLAHRRLGSEELCIETNRLVKIPDGHMDMQTLHALFLNGEEAATGSQSAAQASFARLQQFSVRNPTKAFMRSKFGL